MNTAACCLSVRGLVRSPVHETLALDALKRDLGAYVVVDTETGAVAHAEIKFRKVAVQMLLAHVLICAD